MSTPRTIQSIIPSQATSDGDGVKIHRVAGFNNAKFSPFLMMDELKSDQQADYIGGFPPHPHRGIETLTYMLNGHFQHKDQMGNIGQLMSGGAQWMAAGRGVIHSEMPIMEEGQLHGFQIWINQPSHDKMKPAQYHDFQSDSITEHQKSGLGLIRVILGNLNANSQPLAGPLDKTGVPVTVADWRSDSGDQVKLETKPTHNMMIFIYKGKISIGNRSVDQGEMALLTHGEYAQLTANVDSGVLIFSGQPINEPVVHYGPFVMNSLSEIEQAIQDYNSGAFERY